MAAVDMAGVDGGALVHDAVLDEGVGADDAACPNDGMAPQDGAGQDDGAEGGILQLAAVAHLFAEALAFERPSSKRESVRMRMWAAALAWDLT